MKLNKNEIETLYILLNNKNIKDEQKATIKNIIEKAQKTNEKARLYKNKKRQENKCYCRSKWEKAYLQDKENAKKNNIAFTKKRLDYKQEYYYKKEIESKIKRIENKLKES